MNPTGNLLASVDLSADLHTGRWSARGPEIEVGPDNWARLCLPWHPHSDEYDVTLDFTRRSGNQGFGLLLTGGGVQAKKFLFQLSAVDNQWVSLNRLVQEPHKLDIARPFGPNGVRHQLRLEITRSGIEAFLNETSVLRYATGYRDIESRDWGFGTDCALGLISWYNVIEFHRLEATELARR